MLSLCWNHREHLQFLTEQPLQVVQELSILAMDYFQKGTNPRLCIAAAHKLDIDPERIRKSIESLVYLLVESVKHKLTEEEFGELVVSLGFDNEKEAILRQFYKSKQCCVADAMAITGFESPEYHNMEWRFETQIASKTMLEQIQPLVAVDLTLKNTDESNELKHVVVQTDAINLLHITAELEAALEDGRIQLLREIRRSVK